MLHHPSGVQDERVGGNTPIMDMEEFALMEGNILGQSSALESLFPHGLPSPPEGTCAGHPLHTKIYQCSMYTMTNPSRCTLQYLTL